jgi:metallophosphoesterase (TIGR03767 family)
MEGSRKLEGARAPAVAVATCALLAALLAFGLAASSSAQDASSPTRGVSTLEQRIVPASEGEFRTLGLGPGERYVVREQEIGTARGERRERRRDLLYLGQLSDFQLADEESPARVEFVDYSLANAAWRPSEALNPQIDDAMVRQLNAFAAASPNRDGNGKRRPMDFAINTGDIADSQQLNETEWVRILMEGGPIAPGSGVDPSTSGDPACAALAPAIADAASPQGYTGVQDFDDYQEGASPLYYDPDQPAGRYAEWPAYPGLMDRAQQSFQAAGLDVPSYVTFGNHDALVQGNAAANSGYERTATGCMKPLSPLVTDPEGLAGGFASLDPDRLAAMLAQDPSKVALVPPDPRRQFVSKPQYKQVFRSGTQADGHGFGLVDPAEEQASNGAAGYYSWRPRPGVRFISLDTVSEAGVIGPSADGNIDEPQFEWLRGELEQATRRDELVFLFSHHAIPSLTADVPDESAPPCTGPDAHGHDVQPGCDLDPRASTPIHLGDDLEELLFEHPHAIAWVAGHSHVNSVEPHANPRGSGFWSIRVAAEADWPQQSRLLELFDNRDGTLSIFGTIVDHASPVSAPAPGASAGAFGVDELASLGRTIAFNDPQAGGEACGGGPCGEGEAKDRNVELLVTDPRRDRGGGGGGGSKAGGHRCGGRIEGSTGPERLVGTAGRDRINGDDGRDRIKGRRGSDCLRGGRGADRIDGGRGRDRIRAGSGNDRIRARDGERDRIACGKGRDRVSADPRDTLRGC